VNNRSYRSSFYAEKKLSIIEELVAEELDFGAENNYGIEETDS